MSGLFFRALGCLISLIFIWGLLIADSNPVFAFSQIDMLTPEVAVNNESVLSGFDRSYPWLCRACKGPCKATRA